MMYRFICLARRQFKAMSFAMLEEKDKQPTSYKLICQGENQKVVGLHIIGEGSDEMLQGCESSSSDDGLTSKSMLISLAVASLRLDSWSGHQDGRYQGRL
jgi:pyruvate/2-oxoglutarate dehydrogenase complex dihydrolipoamide dehydrogenase (E3) component